MGHFEKQQQKTVFRQLFLKQVKHANLKKN